RYQRISRQFQYADSWRMDPTQDAFLNSHAVGGLFHLDETWCLKRCVDVCGCWHDIIGSNRPAAPPACRPPWLRHGQAPTQYFCPDGVLREWRGPHGAIGNHHLEGETVLRSSLYLDPGPPVDLVCGIIHRVGSEHDFLPSMG